MSLNNYLNSLPYDRSDVSYDINTNIRVIEVFTSIDGEQPRMGEISTFVRLAGCNLKCNYCDTPHSQTSDNCTSMTVRELVKLINSKVITANVTITGGEPLLQMEAVEELCQRLFDIGYNINIETNGTLTPTPNILKTTNCIIYDYKAPDLFKVDKTCIRLDDVIKFVINSRAAFEVVKEVTRQFRWTKVYVGCVKGEESSLKECDLIQMIIEANLINLHFNTQLHKLVGVA